MRDPAVTSYGIAMNVTTRLHTHARGPPGKECRKRRYVQKRLATVIFPFPDIRHFAACILE